MIWVGGIVSGEHWDLGELLFVTGSEDKELGLEIKEGEQVGG